MSQNRPKFHKKPTSSAEVEQLLANNSGTSVFWGEILHEDTCPPVYVYRKSNRYYEQERIDVYDESSATGRDYVYYAKSIGTWKKNGVNNAWTWHANPDHGAKINTNPASKQDSIDESEFTQTYVPHIRMKKTVVDEAGRQITRMQHLPKETLESFIKKQAINGRLKKDTLKKSQRYALCLAILKALKEQVHDKEVIHQDIKPKNIMVDMSNPDHPVVNFIDFDGSKIIGTATRPTVFTKGYCSPEQWKRESVDEKADIWSVGLTLIQVLVPEILYAYPPPGLAHDMVIQCTGIKGYDKKSKPIMEDNLEQYGNARNEYFTVVKNRAKEQNDAVKNSDANLKIFSEGKEPATETEIMITRMLDNDHTKRPDVNACIKVFERAYQAALIEEGKLQTKSNHTQQEVDGTNDSLLITSDHSDEGNNDKKTSIANSKSTVKKTGYELAYERLQKAITSAADDDDKKIELKAAGKAILDRVGKTKNHPTFPVKYLPHLTRHLNAAAQLVEHRTEENIDFYKRNTKDIMITSLLPPSFFERNARPIKKSAIVGTWTLAGGIIGGLIGGGALGTVLIPIPIVGTVLGAVAGAIIGAGGGTVIGGLIVGAYEGIKSFVNYLGNRNKKTPQSGANSGSGSEELEESEVPSQEEHVHKRTMGSEDEAETFFSESEAVVTPNAQLAHMYSAVGGSSQKDVLDQEANNNDSPLLPEKSEYDDDSQSSEDENKIKSASVKSPVDNMGEVSTNIKVSRVTQ